MVSKWIEHLLGDVIELKRGFDLPQSQRRQGNVPIVSSSGVSGTHSEPRVAGPGVVTGRYGTLGQVFFVPDDFWPLNTTLFVSDFKGNDPKFVSYFLRTLDFLSYSDKAAVPGVNRNHLHTAKILWPPDVAEQRAIAHILGTLDDKIELNRRMNETLEAIARVIFKSWFVDFDPVLAKANGEPPESICRRLGLTPELLALFPDHFQDSELGEIPEGWKISSVEKLSMKVGMGPFGSNIKVSTFELEGIPVISGQHLNDTMLEDNRFNFISKEHADKLASANVARGDIVFTHAGNIGQVAYIPDRSRYVRYVLSQRQFFMRCDISRISPIFMTYFFRSPEGQHKLLANTAQVGVPSIARPVSYLKSIELVVPPKPLVDQFDTSVRTFHQRISIDKSETESLAKLRDALLPKLISGELRVPEAVANERS